MSIIPKLASSIGRRDEEPNQALAKEIVESNDKIAVKELIDNLTNKSKDIQSDCIKTIDEIGLLKPKLIAGYHTDLIKLLDNKNNRLQWGAMAALNNIATEQPDIIFNQLPKLVKVAEAGTVITKDNLMGILVKLCAIPKYAEDAFALFNEQLISSPTNQLPSYAENALPAITAQNRPGLIKTLTARIDDIESETKRKRIEKVLKKLQTK